MKIINLLIMMLLFPILCFSQSKYLFEKKNIEQIRKLESKNNSVFLGYDTIKVAADYFPGAMAETEYYPVKFKRTDDDFFPELYVRYFYDGTSEDSIIVCASYDWNIMHYVKNIYSDGHHFQSERKRRKDYLRKYSEIKSNVIRNIGEPDELSEQKHANDYWYRAQWIKDDIDVLMLFNFSGTLKPFADTKIGTFRIRLKVDYKNDAAVSN